MVSSRPHVVCVPWPTQGHINPMMNLAKLLHHKGCFITFVNTHINHNRLGLDSLGGIPSFQFMSINDPLPGDGVDSTRDKEALFSSAVVKCLDSLRDLVLRLNNDVTRYPPVTCIVSDVVLTCAHDVAWELGIPDVVLWTASVCAFVAYSHFPQLLQKGLVPLEDMDCVTNGYLDVVIEGIPGMEGIRLKDFPSFVRTTNIDDFDINICIKHIASSRRASAIIFNTFDDLEERELMSALSTTLPPIYAIGPIHQLTERVCENSSSFPKPDSSKEDPKCLEWLDSKDPNSVIYVNFGSLVVMTTQQLSKFARGLASSNKNFLWIIRHGLVNGENPIFPPEFLTETKERGLIVSWCPQEQVLSHPSIAGFLTHCGWNSTLESIAAGVPMICWPVCADQITNCWYCCNKWRVGMEMDHDVSRENIEKLVVKLMDTDLGNEMKVKAMKLKRMAQEAVGPNGSSQINLDKLIKEVLFNY